MFILLDIDGVMIPAKSWKSPELLRDGFSAFSTRAINALNNLISEDTTIILTTSHKSTFDIITWKKIFEARGINIKRLDKLPDSPFSATRKEDILNWFMVNKPTENFIIIDDDKSLNDLPAYLKSNLIQTSSLIGLTEDHIADVNRIIQSYKTTLSQSAA